MDMPKFKGRELWRMGGDYFWKRFVKKETMDGHREPKGAEAALRAAFDHLVEKQGQNTA